MVLYLISAQSSLYSVLYCRLLFYLPLLSSAQFSLDSASFLQVEHPTPEPDDPAPPSFHSFQELEETVLLRRPPTGREAVAFVVRRVDECLLQRTYALLASAGPTRDVWLLHEPRHTNTTQQLQLLMELGLHVQTAPLVGLVGGWPALWSHRSHMAKSGFLIWAARHQDRYDHFWHVEEDAFFTGPWAELFDVFRGSGADIVCRLSTPLNEVEVIDLNLSAPFRQSRSHLLLDPKLNISRANKTAWPVLRLSRRLVADLAGSLYRGDTFGAHELILHPFCQARPWCELEEMPPELMGFYHLAGWAGRIPCSGFKCGNCTGADMGVDSCGSCTLQGLHQSRPVAPVAPVVPVAAGKLFHPVKCEAENCGAAVTGIESLAWAGQAERWMALLAN